MLTSVSVANEVTGYEGKFPLYEPTADLPYLIKKIDGIGPPKAEIVSSNSINTDGVFVHSTRVGVRNIVLTIGYNPAYQHNQTMSGLRREMYNYLSPKSFVLLRMNENEVGHKLINGYVESHEPDIFSREPQVIVSILCDDPYFRDPVDKPISNYSGKTVSMKPFQTADTGFVFELVATELITTVRIENFVDDDIYYSTDLNPGDKVSISTERGNKYIRRDTGSGYVNDLNGLYAGSLSMSLRPEVKSFRVGVVGPTTPQLYSVRYRPKHVGV